MLPRKLCLLLLVVLLGIVFGVAHFSFLRDFTRRSHTSLSKTIIHVHETHVDLNNGNKDQSKDEDTERYPGGGNSIQKPVDPIVKSESNAGTDSQDKPETPKEEESTIEKEKIHTKPKDETETSEMKECPKGGRDLVGLMYVDQSIPSEKEIEEQLAIESGGTVEMGGWWKPNDCIARAKVAIIIPFRNRQQQLTLFLRHMHPILQRQLLDYRIFVIDQDGTTPFNRAALFNVGYKEAMKVDGYNCLVFSDVDLLAEDDRNNYGCVTSPRHMSVAVDKFNYRLPYESIFGGVGAFTKDHFETINGFSNMFWGWGGEDDDLYNRITARGLRLTRPPQLLGRYTMIKVHHFQSDGGNPERTHLLHSTRDRMTRDGLNSLVYKVVRMQTLPLVTVVTVDIQRSDHL